MGPWRLVKSEGRVALPDQPRATTAGATIDEVAAADAAAEAAVRAAIRVHGLTPIKLPSYAHGTLSPGENLLAVHPLVTVDRRQFCACPEAVGPSVGPVWLTSRRLLFLGRARLAVELDDIDEALIAGRRRLLLVLRGGTGLAFEMDLPRLLRVQIAAARGRHQRCRL